MRIKLDEDLPLVVAQLLQRHGHDAVTVIQQGLGGCKDEPLWNAVQTERRLLMTADKGFADLRRHPPGTHSGVVLLRPDEDGIPALLDLLGQLLASCDLDALDGAVTTATPRHIRVRRHGL